MDTIVAISIGHGSVKTFEKFIDALNYINQELASWNAFNDSVPIQITVGKQASRTQSLGVTVEDSVDSSDKLA